MPPKNKKPTYQQMLFELLELRENDYDGFMQKLFEALSGDFRDMVNDHSPLDEKSQALKTMIGHFEAREEYEKCAALKTMLDELNQEDR
jgi:hypothetical protein